MPHIKAPSGIEWSYDIEGEGEVLLFIHGWGVDRRIWRQQAKYFSDFFKVMTVDLPGHGKSSWQEVSFKTMAQDLKGILEQLGLTKLKIVASSIGGLLALRLYELMEESILKMSFVGFMPRFARSLDYPFGLEINDIRKLSQQLITAYPSILHIFFRSLFTIDERQTRRFKWLQKFRQTDEVPLREALQKYLDVIEGEDVREVLKTVKVPMQFMSGTQDYICHINSVEHLREMVPQAHFKYFERCGHFPFLSKPYEFNAILEEFLKS